jgi:hypothetical protein
VLPAWSARLRVSVMLEGVAQVDAPPGLKMSQQS